jgi:3-oxocholest-4-en-26-oate---CoA ligase
MHGAAHWNAISAWTSGGTVVVQDDPTRLDPADVLATCARERVSALQIVGDPFARPLLDELDAHDHDLSQLRFLLSGGAVLSAPVKERLVARIPGLRIVDVLGSSETGRQAVAGTDAAFRPERSTVVLSADRTRRLAPGEDEIGWLAQSGRVPLGYLGDEAKTRATFPTVDGVRHAVAGDRVRLLVDGTIELLGRDSVTINTGGEKVFAEEVEQVLTAHPAVADAVVAGRPSERWGSEIVAVLSARPGVTPPGDDELRTHCRTALAGYKVPKAFCWVDRVERSPAGKPDYAWARDLAERMARHGGGQAARQSPNSSVV